MKHTTMLFAKAQARFQSKPSHNLRQTLLCDTYTLSGAQPMSWILFCKLANDELNTNGEMELPSQSTLDHHRDMVDRSTYY